MATLRRSARALCAGGALGCGAFYVASERLRASPPYHWLADRVVTPLLQRLDAVISKRLLSRSLPRASCQTLNTQATARLHYYKPHDLLHAHKAATTIVPRFC